MNMVNLHLLFSEYQKGRNANLYVILVSWLSLLIFIVFSMPGFLNGR